MSRTKTTVAALTAMKGRVPLAALTAYDYPMARLLDEVGIPLILVGDSLGMVVLGYPDTTYVVIEEMEHHTRAVARAKPAALVAADLPYESYLTSEMAVRTAARLVEAGAEVVKAEGGVAICSQVRAIRSAGVEFIGHIGMLPQHVRREGGYSMKGKDASQRNALLADAAALEDAGAFAIVLELVDPSVAAEITALVSIPTIGIGSGAYCDGQILVTTDLLGTFPWFVPKFVKPKLNAAAQMREVLIEWKDSLQTSNQIRNEKIDAPR